MKMHSDLGKMYRRNYMVKSQLRSLEDKSRALNSKIDGETKIDEWAESYITRADAQIDDVSDYMQYRNLGGLAKATGHVRGPAPQTRALPAPSLPHYGQQRQPAPQPSQPTPQPSQPTTGYSTAKSFIDSMPMELQVPFRKIHRQTDFANVDNAIGNYTATTLIKDNFARNKGNVHELVDGNDKWSRESKKYADDNKVSHSKLISLMEAWKNSTVKSVVESSPSPDEVEEAIRLSKGSNLGFSTMDLPLVGAGNTLGSSLGLGAMAAVLGAVTYNEYRSKGTVRAILMPRLKQAGVYGVAGIGLALLYQSIVGTGQKTGWY
jgi:hypothetical protein